MTSPYEILRESTDGYTAESVDAAIRELSSQLSRSESDRAGLSGEISRLSQRVQTLERQLDIALAKLDRSIEQRFSSVDSMNQYAFTDRPAICDGHVYEYDGDRWVMVGERLSD